MKSLLLVFLMAVSSFVRSDIVVVISKGAEVKALSVKEVANIFLSRTNRLPNGLKAFPSELKSPEMRVPFYETIASKTPQQLSAYWSTLVFTGKGRPPRKYDTVEELIEALETTPGKIAYMPADKVTERLQVVYTLKR